MPPRPEPVDLEDTDLSALLGRQLEIAGILQKALIREKNSLTTRELKDLASSASTLLSLSHRTDQVLASLNTYKAFTSVVLEFLKERSDTLGEDLLAKLREVAEEMRADEAVKALMQG
jgi:hypothetical protein